MMERSLKNLGFKVEYLDTAKGETLKEPLEGYSLLVVLGGYMGAYEENLYPFLSYEFRLMEQALKLNIPILGICLGAQMLAKVLGARVFKGDNGKEIGWMEVFKVGEHELFQEFPNTLKVFQWLKSGRSFTAMNLRRRRSGKIGYGWRMGCMNKITGSLKAL
jgi:GMP synthase-like glutamine amidotransferase